MTKIKTSKQALAGFEVHRITGETGYDLDVIQRPDKRISIAYGVGIEVNRLCLILLALRSAVKLAEENKQDIRWVFWKQMDKYLPGAENCHIRLQFLEPDMDLQDARILLEKLKEAFRLVCRLAFQDEMKQAA